MNPKLLLCLALILSAGLSGCSTIITRSTGNVVSTSHRQTLPAEADWQITLRAAVNNGDIFPSGMAAFIYFCTVPADAAKILEREPPAELLPFLAKLRAEPPAWKAGKVDPWITIVRQGLHGTPSVITNTMTSPDGRTITRMEIPVYTYSIHITKPSHASAEIDTNLTKEISDVLIQCQKIKPGMTRADLLKVFTTEDGLSTAEHRTFVYRGCPYIKVDIDFDIPAAAQVEHATNTIRNISKPYLDWHIID